MQPAVLALRSASGIPAIPAGLLQALALYQAQPMPCCSGLLVGGSRPHIPDMVVNDLTWLQLGPVYLQ